MMNTSEKLKSVHIAKGLMCNLGYSGLSYQQIEMHRDMLLSAREELGLLEKGATANKDEGRMVGHYWLRTPKSAPSVEIRTAIEQSLDQVDALASSLGAVKHVYWLGIGGSALGPMFLESVFGKRTPTFSFIDNIDPDGIAKILSKTQVPLEDSIVVVVSKSGTTKETYIAEQIFKKIYEMASVEFSSKAISITQTGSELYKRSETWRAQLPLWDWVGGRTSVWSAVGLLPLALLGEDFRQLLQGAADADEHSRQVTIEEDPSLLMALSWHLAASEGKHNLVVLPYSDRLELLGRYLQQLIMESLGKGQTRDRELSLHGLSVFGNKGTTDQHAFVQQLRDGRNDFIACFIEVLRASFPDRHHISDFEIDGYKITEYLHAFLDGTEAALTEAGRSSLRISMEKVDVYTVGAILAFFERAVSYFASFADINAYHQPGVEAGKRAATQSLMAKTEIIKILSQSPKGCTHETLMAGLPKESKAIFPRVLQRLIQLGAVQVDSEKGCYFLAE